MLLVVDQPRRSDASIRLSALGCLMLLCAGSACAGLSVVVHPPLDRPDTTDVGFVRRTWLFPSRDGLRLFARAWVPTSGAPKATVLIVHDLGDHSGRYDDLGRALALRGYEVRAFDLRGHGYSEGDRAYVHRFSDWVDDCDRFVRLAEAEAAGRPVFLVGQGIGGTIVLTELGTHRATAARLAGVVASAAAVQLDIGWFREGSTKVTAFFAPRLALLDVPVSEMSRDPVVLEALRDDPLLMKGKEPAQTAAEVLRGVDRLRSDLERVTVPLLILSGTADARALPTGSEQLATRARSNDKTLKRYPGALHDLWHDLGHEAVVSDLSTWLDAHLTPAKP